MQAAAGATPPSKYTGASLTALKHLPIRTLRHALTRVDFVPERARGRGVAGFRENPGDENRGGQSGLVTELTGLQKLGPSPPGSFRSEPFLVMDATLS